MSNATASQFLAREIALETERRNNAEDRKELRTEMKSAGLTAVEIAGVKLAVKRHFEDAERANFRRGAEEIADSLGQLAGTPLGRAAVEARPHA